MDNNTVLQILAGPGPPTLSEVYNPKSKLQQSAPDWEKKYNNPLHWWRLSNTINGVKNLDPGYTPGVRESDMVEDRRNQIPEVRHNVVPNWDYRKAILKMLGQ